MSVKFQIKSVLGAPVKEGDQIVRYTGSAEPYTHATGRECLELGMNEKGDAILTYNTGLDEKKVDLYWWYNDTEKAIIKKEIASMKPLITASYGGEAMIKDTNTFFWRQPIVNNLKVTNETEEIFFDTAKPAAALLYLSIISGAFMDVVAPTKEWAEKHQLPHYLVLESEDTFEDEDEITRSDAHGALSELRKDASNEALFILAWCLQYDTDAYGAQLRSTPVKELINYHIKYIDGKLKLKGARKKNFPKNFMEYAKKWASAKTKELLYAEAYIKAGEYFNFIQKRDKKYHTVGGTALGNTVAEAVESIMKDKNLEEFEKLRDSVEAKWKE